MRRLLLLALAGLVAGTAGAADAPPAGEAPFFGPIHAGMMEAPPRHESSGLAVSRRSPDILWTHDDSGGDPVLYAVDLTGKKRGALRVLGLKNEDWEDVASFTRDGQAWLLIADTGDNDAKEGSVWLHVVAEPAPEHLDTAGELSAAPAYSLRIRYEDGPRDCESVAVDGADQAIYLLTKRDDPPRLYRVPLGPAQEKSVTARFVGTVPVAGNSGMDFLMKKILGKKVAWPTAMDFAADGRRAVVLTYGEVLVFAREPGEPWLAALQRAPARLMFHGLPQAEGACFSPDGRTIYVSSEGTQPLIRYELR